MYVFRFLVQLVIAFLTGERTIRTSIELLEMSSFITWPEMQWPKHKFIQYIFLRNGGWCHRLWSRYWYIYLVYAGNFQTKIYGQEAAGSHPTSERLRQHIPPKHSPSEVHIGGDTLYVNAGEQASDEGHRDGEKTHAVVGHEVLLRSLLFSAAYRIVDADGGGE